MNRLIFDCYGKIHGSGHEIAGSHTQRLITRATFLDEGGEADEELVGSQNVIMGFLVISPKTFLRAIYDKRVHNYLLRLKNMIYQILLLKRENSQSVEDLTEIKI